MIVFAMLISSALTSCSPIVIRRYDSDDTKAMHQQTLKAQKDLRRVKVEYARVYDLWNEADEIIDELQEALAECRQNK